MGLHGRMQRRTEVDIVITDKLSTTEASNPRTEKIDDVSSSRLLELIHAEDGAVLNAITKELPQITAALDAIVDALTGGGRMFYIGAGTSGRLGVLDASEIPPTFNSSPDLIQGIIAGGDVALRHAVEGAEDDPTLAVQDLKQRDLCRRDILVGIAASGRTPYVLGGMNYASELGAATVGISCVENSKVSRAAQLPITPVVGPEAISGSTRMKAGTATKLVLNMLSTGAMVRLGYVYGNLMVNVQTTNKKLEDRAVRILMQLTELSSEAAAVLLATTGDLKTAIVMSKMSTSRRHAEELLRHSGGRLWKALGTE